MTSCTWDYVTYTLANRSYTMMLCCFVFFIPLAIILSCYLLMFLAVRKTSRYQCKLSFLKKTQRNPLQILCSETEILLKASIYIFLFLYVLEILKSSVFINKCIKASHGFG